MPPWTKEKEKILREICTEKSVKDILKLKGKDGALTFDGHSYDSVATKMKKLGLKGPSKMKKGRHYARMWSLAETKWLQMNWAKISKRELVLRFKEQFGYDRTWLSIKNKSENLSLGPSFEGRVGRGSAETKFQLTAELKDILTCILSTDGMSRVDITNVLNISGIEFDKRLKMIRSFIPITYSNISGVYRIGQLRKIDEATFSVVKAIDKLKINENEIERVLQNLRTINPSKYVPQHISFSDSHVKIGVFSDLHVGHKNYRADILRHASENFRRQDVDLIVNCGDTIEGMSNREGHIYELDYIGISPQKNFLVEEFQMFSDQGMIVHSIEADTSHSGWGKVKANQGVDIGPELDEKVESYKFIGYNEQDLILDNGLKIRLRHPGGGSAAYCLTYKIQKYIESIAGVDKPSILLEGHFHKCNYIFYRNIHAYDAACLQQQSPFMKRLGTPAHLGYWILDAYISDEGTVERMLQEFVPFSDQKGN